MKIPPKKEKKKKQAGTKKSVGRGGARKKGPSQVGGETEETVGEMEESRSPTPTPPVLEPEVPIKLPTPPVEAESDVSTNDTEDNTDQSMEEEPKHIPRLLDAAGEEKFKCI